MQKYQVIQLSKIPTTEKTPAAAAAAAAIHNTTMAIAPPNSLLTTRLSLFPSSLSSSSSSASQQPTAKILSSMSPPSNPLTLTIKHNQIITPITNNNNDIHSLVFPSLAFSNTLFFKTPYNVQVIVAPDESEESLIGRFRREVFRANVIQECKRRKFFETNQEKRKRKFRDAARRRARRRPRPQAKKEEVPRKKVVDDESDNWDQIDVEVPYCR